MFEKESQLASAEKFRKRLWNNTGWALILLVVSLLIGVSGYEYTIPEFDIYDSILNASMILSGMGPVIDSNIRLTDGAKLFAAFYALFSGISFLTIFSLIIAPVLHRLLHKFHLDDQQ